MFRSQRLASRRRFLTLEQLESRALLAVILVPEQRPSIQDAIDGANPGDIISIRGGTYHEQLTINKNLTLQGRPGRTGLPVISPGQFNGDGITVEPGVASVTLCNLRVTGWEINGIQIGELGEDEVQRVALKNVIADFNGDDGIDIENTAVASLVAVLANRNDDDGLDAEEVDQLTVEAGAFNDNGVDEGGSGLEVINTNGLVKLVGVAALRNFDDGVFVEAFDDEGPEATTNVVIIGGIFNRNGVFGGGQFGGEAADGCELTNVNNVSITGINAWENHEDGLDIDGARGRVTVTGGTFKNNGQAAADEGGDGIDIDGVLGKITLTGVVALGNFADGLNLEEVSDVCLTGGTFSKNGGNGVQMDDVGNVLITGIVSERNVGDGLDIFGAGFVTVKSSSFLRNGDDGIDLGDVAGHLFQAVVSLLNGDNNFEL